MSAESSGQTPQTSQWSPPFGPSSTHSRAIASDPRSFAIYGDDEAFGDHDYPHPLMNEARDDSTVTHDAGQEEPRHRQHRPRKSGGFLLPNASTPARESFYSNNELQLSEIAKGKRKAEHGDLIVPKRGSRSHKHTAKLALGNSPLATEVLPDYASEKRTENSELSPAKRSSIQSGSSRAARSTDSSHRPSTQTTYGTNTHELENPKNALGHDTDPAQIVNLALNLSESRRRNFSSGSHLVPRDVAGSRRLVSAGAQNIGIPYSTSGGSLRQHLQQQRRTSRNLSPRSGKSSSGKEATSPSQRQEKRNSRVSSRLQGLETTVDQDVTFTATDATFARAEQARVAFDLLYEYRRLLQYLPVIPAIAESRASTSDGADNRAQSQFPQLFGMPYDPLQYIRNRKVRLRQRRPLTTESDGWKNVDRVRSWVDAVKNEREKSLARGQKFFRLPPFDGTPATRNMTDDLQSPAAAQARKSVATNPARPAMDWITTPWDLLADIQWLFHDRNIDFIEDRWGKNIATSSTSFRGDYPRSSKESFRKERSSTSLSRRNSSPRRADILTRDDSRERGLLRKGIHHPKSSVDAEHSSREHKSKWSKRFIRSRNPSTSDESDWGKESLGRRAGDRQRGRSQQLNNAALEKQMKDLLDKEAEHDENTSIGSDDGLNRQTTRAESVRDLAPSNIASAQDNPRRPQAIRRLMTQMASPEKRETSPRASLDERRLEHHRMSSDDFDTTAPNSPVEHKHVPSIAINFSPPASPEMIVTAPKKPVPSRVGTFKRSRSRSMDRRATSVNDLGTESLPTHHSQQELTDLQSNNRLRRERTSDSAHGYFTPGKISNRATKPGGLETSSLKSVRDSGGGESKFRGLFKSGRIAELVGNEVSRVGDILWKRDSSNNSHVPSPVSSRASEDSDIEGVDISVLDGSSNGNVAGMTTSNEGLMIPSPKPPIPEQPKYHRGDLPNFRSQHSKEDQANPSKASLDHHDHITRQQLSQRDRSRSSRFDRLAPPKIDMRSVSPSPSVSIRRSQSRGPESRDSSGTRSNSGVHRADKKLNDMLDIPGRAGSTDLKPPTGLAAFEARPRNLRKRPSLESHREWSISNRDMSTVRGTISNRDVARVRALLLSSGVKANEINRIAEEIPSTPPPLLRGLQDLFSGPVPLAPKSQQHAIAARTLFASIEGTNRQLRNAMDRFSQVTVEDLYTQTKGIDDRVTYQLTPLVRTSADDADVLNTELTTTHTLAFKQLNDSIDVILRRRRRRLRWIRRAGWAMLEWTLLGIMWLVWFIVVIVRLVKGTLGTLIAAVRWLFWL